VKKWLIVVIFISSYSTASPSVRIDNPKVDGIALDWCKTWGSECGKPTADYFCRYKGYSFAKSFQIDKNVAYTKILKTGQICNQDFCSSFKYITCSGSKSINYQRFSYPKYNGVALDFCYTFGKNCGQKVANEFCKFKGYKDVYRFKKENNVGYTIIMRTGQFCKADFCSSFKYIDCRK
jgi:hypothetical protein